MMKIRVGVTGWNGASAAEYLEEARTSRNIRWVEIDGQRFEGATLIQVAGQWGAGFHTTTVEFIGTPEFVPLDKDGAVLSGR